MTSKVSVFVGCLLGIFIGVSGCSSTPSESPQSDQTQVEGIAIVPELNTATGVLKLPLDPFGESEEEEGTLNTAHTIEMAKCASDQGVEYLVEPEFPPSVQQIYAQRNYFGPWTVEQAERWGFVEPMSLKDLIANGILPDDTPATDTFLPPEVGKRTVFDLTEDEFEVVRNCNEEAGNHFSEPLRHDGGWWQEYEPLEFNYQRNKDAVALVDELGACFSENEMVPEYREGTPWYPQGARGDRIDEVQIRMALQVVACKDSINFTQRMAQVEASEQVPLIEKYAAEMIAKRELIDAAVVAAKKVIAENPEFLLKINSDHKP